MIDHIVAFRQGHVLAVALQVYPRRVVPGDDSVGDKLGRLVHVEG